MSLIPTYRKRLWQVRAIFHHANRISEKIAPFQKETSLQITKTGLLIFAFMVAALIPFKWHKQ
ncbi:MAG TPA: hypothetical protein DD670_14945 [Planctomycetaceae bacterium]|nr:hypothetical protein [Planctomycetaceae bacterium]